MHYNEKHNVTLRSKSKSPRHSRREAVEDLQLPSPPQSPLVTTTSPLSIIHPTPRTPTNISSGKLRSKPPRRPHTSAGPRDKSNLPYSAQPEVGLRSNPTVKVHIVQKSDPRRDSNRLTRPLQTEAHGNQPRNDSVHVHRINQGLSTRVRVPSDQVRDWEAELARIESESQKTTDSVRDWEAELARIENQSRRSSADMLGFRGGTKRRVMAETTERNRSL